MPRGNILLSAFRGGRKNSRGCLAAKKRAIFGSKKFPRDTVLSPRNGKKFSPSSHRQTSTIMPSRIEMCLNFRAAARSSPRLLLEYLIRRSPLENRASRVNKILFAPGISESRQFFNRESWSSLPAEFVSPVTGSWFCFVAQINVHSCNKIVDGC